MTCMAAIYVLIDPRNEEIRYVGKTRGKLDGRLRAHMQTTGTFHRARWITELRNLGLTPRIEAVQQVPCEFDGDAERYWIAFYKACGCDLTNGTLGGDGWSGPMSAEHRANISNAHRGKKRSPEVRAQLKLAQQRLRRDDPEFGKTWRRKSPMSDAERQMHRERNTGRAPGNKGKQASAETRARMVARWKHRRDPRMCEECGKGPFKGGTGLSLHVRRVHTKTTGSVESTSRGGRNSHTRRVECSCGRTMTLQGFGMHFKYNPTHRRKDTS